MAHAIRFEFRTFLGPFHGPFTLGCFLYREYTESTVQPRDGGTDLLMCYKATQHSGRGSCYTHPGTCGSETARSGVLDVHVHRAWRDRAHPVHVQQAKETVAVGTQ